jgi:oligoribonuclease NrnB/cAMP/cGMP phosphodiesterase (DHH superfamily)
MGRESRAKQVRSITSRKKALFTHGDLDGIVCGIVFKRIYPNSYIFFTNYKETVDCREINEAILEVVPEFPEDVSILISDISVSEDVAEFLNQRGSVGLLDHHKTALPLTRFPWVKVDMNKSGCLLVYEMLASRFYLTDLWPLVELADTYDRWQQNHPKWEQAKQLNRLLSAMGRDAFIYRFMSNSSVDLTPTDKLMLQTDEYHRSKYIARSIQLAQVLTDRYGNKFCQVFADRYVSEVGHELLNISPEDIAYVLMIDIRERVCSLRGRGMVDLSALAKEFGGGGHHDSAGFPLQSDTLAKLIGVGELSEEYNTIEGEEALRDRGGNEGEGHGELLQESFAQGGDQDG